MGGGTGKKKEKWEKKSVSELKSYLKSLGLSCSGDKGTLLWRIGIGEKVEENGLLTEDGKNPCELKPAELRRSCACAGLSPIGSNDELLSSLVDHLMKTSSTKSEASDNAKSASVVDEKSSEKSFAVAIAKKILSLDEIDDFEGILNLLGGDRITKLSPLATMRKAYLKLSLLIHPDKLSRDFDQATKAFQALVRALELLSQPEVVVEPNVSGGKGKKKVAKISRSNDGCYRTRVCCPRCKQTWSEGTVDGNPDYFYNFMMMGLKSFSCSTCLCEFGAITAIHKCPFCYSSFEYSPLDYHRKIKCENKKCAREFGFYLYHISDRMMDEMKRSVKVEQEKMVKAQRTKRRRAEGRASNRGKISEVEEEDAFVMGLVDCCPRCGLFFEKYRNEGEAQRLHLIQCGDRKQHAEYQAQKRYVQEREAEREKNQAKQLEVQTLAQWEFLGAKSSQLYLLNDSQLKSVAAREGQIVDEDMTKEDIIHFIASTRSETDDYSSSRKRLRTGVSNSSGDEYALDAVPRKVRIVSSDIPENMYGMSSGELKQFCASQGLLIHKGASKSDIIEEIEKAIE